MSRIRLADAIALILAAALIVVALTCDRRAYARELIRTPGGLTALELARVCVNEDSRPLRNGGEITEDCLGIVQTAVTVQRIYRHRSVLAALRRLAPHVTKQRPPKRTRHALNGTLPGIGVDRPILWDPAVDGPWERYGPNWVRFRDRLRRLLKEGFEPPCPGNPITWGCHERPGCNDTPIAIKRGLTRLDCGELNAFWRK